MPTTFARVTEPVNIADLERLAAERLEPGAHGYFAGGAGDERTLLRYAVAVAGWELRPRVLVRLERHITVPASAAARAIPASPSAWA